MSEILHKLISDPTAVIDPSVDSSDVLGLVKTIFDPITKGYSVLDEIYVDGLDASQVWPQTKIILDNVTDSLLFERIPQLKGSVMNSSDFSEQELSDNSLEGNREEEDDEDVDEDEENENENENENEQEYEDFVDDYEEEPLSDDQEGYSSAIKDRTKREREDEDEQTEDKQDAFGLNDGFFSIDDFNKQILEQENENGDTGVDHDEDIDYFGDIPDSDDEEVAYYDDFFAKPKSLKDDPRKSKKQPSKSKKKQEEERDLNDEDFDNGMKSAMLDLFDEEEPGEAQAEKNLSSFERQQLQIQGEISKLEQEAIAEKKWAMKGEAKAKDRPADALLEEDLEFERTAKPVPVITREVTESLEEMIRRRIKEGNFDDLPRRIITDVTNFKPSSSFKLSEEKSSKSLAEMYEEEYKGIEDNQVSEELQKAHDEIKELFTSISYKLDALSSAHFIPKPAQKAIDIRVNAPTISMEDAQPLTQSSASTLAPQEIYKATTSGNDTEIQLKSGTVFSRDELSREDKQRMRRANKRKRAKEFKEKEQRGPAKKSKKQDVIDTLSKAKNVTVIDSKGQRRDFDGSVKKDKVSQGISYLKS